MSRLRPDERAFTWLEFLVVIVIMGILVALLLPAFQMAREASHRANDLEYAQKVAEQLVITHDLGGGAYIFTGPNMNDKDWCLFLKDFIKAHNRKVISVNLHKSDHDGRTSWGAALVLGDEQ